MSRHSVSARRWPSVFNLTTVPQTDAPLPRTRSCVQATVVGNPPSVDIEGYPRFFDRRKVTRNLAMVKLTPREIEIRIGRLIQTSLNGRSTAMAIEIVRHIEALCTHPDDRRSPEERCILRRLAGHWRRLAWLAVDSESEGNVTPGAAFSCCQPIGLIGAKPPP